MNKPILFIVFIAAIIGGYFLLIKIPTPIINHIRIGMSVALLILVWTSWGVDHKNWIPQVVISLIALSSIITEVFKLRKIYSKK